MPRSNGAALCDRYRRWSLCSATGVGGQCNIGELATAVNGLTDSVVSMGADAAGSMSVLHGMKRASIRAQTLSYCSWGHPQHSNSAAPAYVTPPSTSIGT